MAAFARLLVANRGEIACRVMRTARRMGLETVAVYSDADDHAPHVKLADLAVHIGSSRASDSYLNADKIVAAALESGAEAVHPGYGFLSEDADFARLCIDAGLVFVGPSPDAILTMGDKVRAKAAMTAAGVPCVPGYQGEDQSDAVLAEQAERIGFPVMIKAAMGGGGHGIRLVSRRQDLVDAIKWVRLEAGSAFRSGALILEKAIGCVRHVEIQICADSQGHVIHLGERDCSVQRRFQKVIEESPCPVMTPKLRLTMGQVAVNAARAVDYCGVGTVEFLLDEAGDFYFLEMNTRLQVEHPVTEAVTGLDLVALQLDIAAGMPLELAQQDVRFSGHAIEARLCAENPAGGFLPNSGPIHLWRAPAGEGIRVDTGVQTGVAVTPFYDSMIAKIIAHGNSRDEARRRLITALGDTVLFGVQTNRDFLINLLHHPVFCEGKPGTTLVAEVCDDAGNFVARPTAMDLAMGVVIRQVLEPGGVEAKTLDVGAERDGQSGSNQLQTIFTFASGSGVPTTAKVQLVGTRNYQVTVGGAIFVIALIKLTAPYAELSLGGVRYKIAFMKDTGTSKSRLHIVGASSSFALEIMAVRRVRAKLITSEASSSVVAASTHGKLLKLLVSVGDFVEQGDKLAVFEAATIQHEIGAPLSGRVSTVRVASSEQLVPGDFILKINPKEGDDTRRV